MPTNATPIENQFTGEARNPGEKLPDGTRAFRDEMLDFGQTTAETVADGKATANIGSYKATTAAQSQARSRPGREKPPGRGINGSAAGARALITDHPLTMTAIAFGGGIAIVTMLARRKLRGLGLDHGALDTIKYALIGLAATKVMNAVAHIAPGFDEHLRRYEEETKNAPSCSFT